MVTGAGHHAVYAHSGQRLAEEQSALRSRPIHLSSRKQQLSLSGRPATQLRRFECQESNPCLHRKPQTLWCVPAMLFAELKNQIGLRRLRLRRMKFVREQFFLAAAAQNIKRLVRFLSQVPKPPLAATA